MLMLRDSERLPRKWSMAKTVAIVLCYGPRGLYCFAVHRAQGVESIHARCGLAAVFALVILGHGTMNVYVCVSIMSLWYILQPPRFRTCWHVTMPRVATSAVSPQKRSLRVLRAEYFKRKGDIRDIVHTKTAILNEVRDKIRKLEGEIKEAEEELSR
ncbi:unnamed protein product [Symbiodinium natans]|uniref:Uncharacterized protein n=1 Tax=Symbiodinium natans TaxID=878477 RepID=A0A812G4L9_9DINO|nr:unnamed protein product [Symbiodinium natans]